MKRRELVVGDPMSVAELRALWTEKVFQGHVERLAQGLGWRTYHTWNSMRSVKGFPDLVLVRGERLVFVELKAERKKLTREQEEWRGDLLASGRCECYVWRPSNWDALGEVLS